MADIGIALSVTKTLFEKLQSPVIKEAYSVWGYKSQLEDLKRTVRTVQCLLIEAGNKIALSQIDRDYIQKLKDGVYDADDLFDKFITLAERKKRKGKLSDKVSYLFSSQNPVKVACSIFRDVKMIRNHLNAIADNHDKFGFSVDTLPLRRRREETCSYVYAHDILGREDDTSKVIHRLLDSDDDIGFLTIVGIGGLGKTTLAKLVSDDERIKSEFYLRLWACVSDQDGASLHIKDILVNILLSAGYHLDLRPMTIEEVQSGYQRILGGKKLLLVLDDIWTENVLEWNKLREFLMIGGTGSRIVATTRSKETAKIIGNDIHELEGLSIEHSRRLFEMTTCQNTSISSDFVEISEKIIEKCYNLPLTIKVVGSLLYGQPIDKWQTLEMNGFAGISNCANEVMSILKFSYDLLEPSLKSCFAYCALFPKDFVIDKEMIINLWEAQGLIVPFDKDQTIESAGEEHFSVLLRRCFFHDVKKNNDGDVESFKIHDLMHDLAQKVAENEICITNSTMTVMEYSIARHLLEVSPNVKDDYFIQSKIRSYIYTRRGESSDPFPFSKITKNWVCLKVLSLQRQCIICPPATIGSLRHLRYLNLSNNDSLKKLPDSIAKLYNLRTLNLNNCYMLETWPKDFSKLVNLTHLYITNCTRLRYMPVGMSKLSRLRVLTDFMVEDESNFAEKYPYVGQLKDIDGFAKNLKGRLVIRFHLKFKWAEGYDHNDDCLKGAENLKELVLEFRDSDWEVTSDDEGVDEDDEVNGEAVIGRLMPHPNLKSFELSYYPGREISRWGSKYRNLATYLPNLIHIKLSVCNRLQELPVLNKLKRLKSLHLSYLRQLEYMEEEVASSSCRGSSGSSKHEITFFPSLEHLTIVELPKLKRWWKSGNENMHYQPGFPRLSELIIRGCYTLTSFPSCPSLKKTLLSEDFIC